MRAAYVLILLAVWVLLLTDIVESLCGFGKINRTERILKFPKTVIKVPTDMQMGQVWTQGIFECALYSIGVPNENWAQATCCAQFANIDTDRWLPMDRRELLQKLVPYVLATKGG